MRTTLTLDHDVAHYLKKHAKLEDKTFKQIVNDVLRRGMASDTGTGGKKQRFKVKPHKGGFRAGVDLLKLNQLADELEADAFRAEENRKARS